MRKKTGRMGVDPNATETTVAYGSAPTATNEIAILNRSIMKITIEMTSQIDAPDEPVVQGRTNATLPEAGPGTRRVPPFSRVHTGTNKPIGAFPAIRNRGHGCGIDDRNPHSKTNSTLRMILFSLTETGAPPEAPLITLPVGSRIASRVRETPRPAASRTASAARKAQETRKRRSDQWIGVVCST